MWIGEVIKQDNSVVDRYYLKGPVCRIGRSPLDCSIAFPSEKSMSRVHAEISIQPAIWPVAESAKVAESAAASDSYPTLTITDLGSSFGTMLDDMELPRNQSRTISPSKFGVVVKLGKSQSLRLRIVAAKMRFCLTRPEKAERERMKRNAKVVGAVIVNAAEHATHVVASKYTPTAKMLAAVALKLHVVTVDWLASFAESDRPAPVIPSEDKHDYQPVPFSAETNFQPDLDRTTLMVGILVFVAKEADESYAVIMEACGATVVRLFSRAVDSPSSTAALVAEQLQLFAMQPSSSSPIGTAGGRDDSGGGGGGTSTPMAGTVESDKRSTRGSASVTRRRAAKAAASASAVSTAINGINRIHGINDNNGAEPVRVQAPVVPSATLSVTSAAVNTKRACVFYDESRGADPDEELMEICRASRNKAKKPRKRSSAAAVEVELEWLTASQLATAIIGFHPPTLLPEPIIPQWSTQQQQHQQQQQQQQQPIVGTQVSQIPRDIVSLISDLPPPPPASDIPSKAGSVPIKAEAGAGVGSNASDDAAAAPSVGASLGDTYDAADVLSRCGSALNPQQQQEVGATAFTGRSNDSAGDSAVGDVEAAAAGDSASRKRSYRAIHSTTADAAGGTSDADDVENVKAAPVGKRVKTEPKDPVVVASVRASRGGAARSLGAQPPQTPDEGQELEDETKGAKNPSSSSRKQATGRGNKSAGVGAQRGKGARVGRTISAMVRSFDDEEQDEEEGKGEEGAGEEMSIIVKKRNDEVNRYVEKKVAVQSSSAPGNLKRRRGQIETDGDGNDDEENGSRQNAGKKDSSRSVHSASASSSSSPTAIYGSSSAFAVGRKRGGKEADDGEDGEDGDEWLTVLRGPARERVLSIKQQELEEQLDEISRKNGEGKGEGKGQGQRRGGDDVVTYVRRSRNGSAGAGANKSNSRKLKPKHKLASMLDSDDGMSGDDVAPAGVAGEWAGAGADGLSRYPRFPRAEVVEGIVLRTVYIESESERIRGDYSHDSSLLIDGQPAEGGRGGAGGGAGGGGKSTSHGSCGRQSSATVAVDETNTNANGEGNGVRSVIVNVKRFRKNAVRSVGAAQQLRVRTMERVLPKETEREIQLRLDAEALRTKEHFADQMFSDRFDNGIKRKGAPLPAVASTGGKASSSSSKSNAKAGSTAPVGKSSLRAYLSTN